MLSPIPLGPRGRRYEPDAKVTLLDGTVCIDDVKPQSWARKASRPWSAGDAVEKLRHVAFRFQQYRVRIVWKNKATGEWLYEVVTSIVEGE